MSETQNGQDGQKTVVTFIAGLLIGGLLVWVFSSGDASAPADDVEATDKATEEVVVSIDEAVGEDETSTEAEIPVLQTGDGAVSVVNQSASSDVAIDGATFPNDEGWIGVRDYKEGSLGFILGVARFSKEQGLIPDSIVLQRPTIAGETYAVVFYTESGDRKFDPRDDFMVEGVMSTFVAE